MLHQSWSTGWNWKQLNGRNRVHCECVHHDSAHLKLTDMYLAASGQTAAEDQHYCRNGQTLQKTNGDHEKCNVTLKRFDEYLEPQNLVNGCHKYCQNKVATACHVSSNDITRLHHIMSYYFWFLPQYTAQHYLPEIKKGKECFNSKHGIRLMVADRGNCLLQCLELLFNPHTPKKQQQMNMWSVICATAFVTPAVEYWLE